MSTKEKHDSCAGCRYDIGGGRDNCTLCVAAECRDGGGFEAWKAREIPENIARAISTRMQGCMDMSSLERRRDEILTEIEMISGEKIREQVYETVRADRHKYGIAEEIRQLEDAKIALLNGHEAKDVLKALNARIAMMEVGLL